MLTTKFIIFVRKYGIKSYSTWDEHVYKCMVANNIEWSLSNVWRSVKHSQYSDMNYNITRYIQNKMCSVQTWWHILVWQGVQAVIMMIMSHSTIVSFFSIRYGVKLLWQSECWEHNSSQLESLEAIFSKQFIHLST